MTNPAFAEAYAVPLPADNNNGDIVSQALNSSNVSFQSQNSFFDTLETIDSDAYREMVNDNSVNSLLQDSFTGGDSYHEHSKITRTNSLSMPPTAENDGVEDPDMAKMIDDLLKLSN